MDIFPLGAYGIFILAVFGLLVVPGFFVMRACCERRAFAPLEYAVLAVPLSFVAMTLALIVADRFGMPLDRVTVPLVTGCLIATAGTVSIARDRLGRTRRTVARNAALFRFSRLSTAAIVVLITLTVGVKGYYLVNTIFPTSTDLGHHLYWVAKAVSDRAMPQYTERDIVTADDGHYKLSDPVAMPDFIVGEHAVLAALFTATGLPIVDVYASLVLFIVNIFTVLVLFVLARRLFDRYERGADIAILTLAIAGPLWALAGAQAKFVSGGVMGNVFGNLLIPTAWYFLLRATREKRVPFLVMAIVTATTLAYTHHLSALIFGYGVIFAIGIFVACNPIMHRYRDLVRLAFHPATLLTLVISVAWLLWVQPPSYLNADTIASSVGAPTKSTRIGISVGQLPSFVGEARWALGVVGMVLIGSALLWRRVTHRRGGIALPLTPSVYAAAIILGWGGAIILMSTVPHLLRINILSSRVVTYAVFPLSIAAAYALVWATTVARRADGRARVPQSVLTLLLVVCLTYLFASGVKSNAETMSPAPRTNRALQTFHAGTYAARAFAAPISRGDTWMIKDHNYITADTWLKIFFAHEYNFPFSRAYFARYESTPGRETCTLEMITTPASDMATRCYDDLRVGIVLVATEQDAAQFLAHPAFARVYHNNSLSMFVRIPNR